MREIKEGDVVMCKIYGYEVEYVKAKVLRCISDKLYDVKVLSDRKEFYVLSHRIKPKLSLKHKLK